MTRAGAGPRPGASAARPENSGLLLVDKPAGPTSHDVVVRVRRSLGAPGAGHLGTLDPPATGLLVIALGAATRCVPLLQSGEKTYEVGITFGVETDTEDASGKVLARSEVACDEAAIRAESRDLVGSLDQIPPMVSAIRVLGERLHHAARRGVTIDRAPRRVHVHAWEWLDFALPTARARIVCSPGTYVRALVRDLGRALGCGATVAELRRIASAPWNVEHAVSAEDLARLPAEALRSKGGVPLGEALRRFPAIVLAAAERLRLADGRAIERATETLAPGVTLAPDVTPAPGTNVVLRDADDVPLAIATALAGPDGGISFQPRIVFPWAVRGAGA